MLLPFEPKLEKAFFIKRYKRFLADIQWPNQDMETVHCANSGSMRSCLQPGAPVYVQKSKNPNRKLPYTWELIQLDDGLACVNTQRANQLVAKLLQAWRHQKDLLPTHVRDFCQTHFSPWQGVCPEYAIGAGTRFDFCLMPQQEKILFDQAQSPLCLIEVKSVSLYEKGVCLFPDAVTTRGQKHALELSRMIRMGHKAWLFFVLLRGSSTTRSSFQLASHIDPAYAHQVQEALDHGVQVALIHTIRQEQGLDISHMEKWICIK